MAQEPEHWNQQSFGEGNGGKQDDNELLTDYGAGSFHASSSLGALGSVQIFLALALPNAALIVFFSEVGHGLEVLAALSRQDSTGEWAFLLSCFSCAVLYVLGWLNWRPCLRAWSLALPWMLISVGLLLQAWRHPGAPLLVVQTHMLLFIGALRAGPFKDVDRVQFYRVAYLSTFLCAAALLTLWLLWVEGGAHMWNRELEAAMAEHSADLYGIVYPPRPLVYATDCGRGATYTGLGPEEIQQIKDACSKARSVLFLVWACPLVGFFCDIFLGAFIWLNGVASTLDECELERNLKRFVLLLTACCMGLYGSVELSEASIQLGSLFMAVFLVSLFGLIAWVLLELGRSAIIHRVESSRFNEMLREGLQSDLARALAVGMLNVAIPIFFALDFARQRVRRLWLTRCGSSADAIVDPVTVRTQWLLNELLVSDWASILCYICLLGELFFMFQVGVAKATSVFLSWLNEILDGYSYWCAIVLIILVGYTMFLLPPVPGVPVYLFSGVVLTQQAPPSVGFVGGCIVATVVAFVLKLVACTGQYAIGYYLARSVKIQQLIGVDKVFTRAIEDILKRPGLDTAKVAVLVGGPDWPVSVTCGILRLNVPQVIWGTCPVIFVLLPCVLAGAAMGQATGDGKSLENLLTQLFVGLSAFLQMASMFLAVYYTTLVIDAKGEELAQPRPEHDAVRQLTEQEERYNSAYKAVTRWRFLSVWWEAVIVLGALLMWLSGCIFTFRAEKCFREFRINSRIGDSFEKGGLGGNALDLVLPMGWVAMAIFSVACFLHSIFLVSMSKLANRRLEERSEVEMLDMRTAKLEENQSNARA